MALILVIQRQNKKRTLQKNGSTDKVPSILNTIFGKVSDLSATCIFILGQGQHHTLVKHVYWIILFLSLLRFQNLQASHKRQSDSDSNVSGGIDGNKINNSDISTG